MTLGDLYCDVQMLNTGFEHGKRLGVMRFATGAHPLYTTQFMADRLFEAEGGDLYEVRIVGARPLAAGGGPPLRPHPARATPTAASAFWRSRRGAKSDVTCLSAFRATTSSATSTDRAPL